MSTDTHISDTRHGHILAELASLGLTLARDLHERALAAETSEEAARLATAFHRISRGVRQSLALEAKLGREQEAHDARLAPVREKARAVEAGRRREAVLRAVQPMIWDEADDLETAGHLVDDLRELLAAEALEPEFLAEPLAAQIERIRGVFGLTGETPERADDPIDDDEIDDDEIDDDDDPDPDTG